jgi:hypothetical protein
MAHVLAMRRIERRFLGHVVYDRHKRVVNILDARRALAVAHGSEELRHDGEVMADTVFGAALAEVEGWPALPARPSAWPG